MKRILCLFLLIGSTVFAQIRISDIEKATENGKPLSRDEMRFVLLDYWELDSTYVREWLSIPQRPVLDEQGDTIPNTTWIEFEGVDRLLRKTYQGEYRDGGIVGTGFIAVDTLYQVPKDTVQ